MICILLGSVSLPCARTHMQVCAVESSHSCRTCGVLGLREVPDQQNQGKLRQACNALWLKASNSIRTVSGGWKDRQFRREGAPSKTAFTFKMRYCVLPTPQVHTVAAGQALLVLEI